MEKEDIFKIFAYNIVLNMFFRFLFEMKFKDIFMEREGKTLLDKDILKKKFNINQRQLLIPLVLLVFFLINKKYFVFGLLSVLSGIFSFFHDKYNRAPIDFKLPLFLGILISWKFGLLYAAIFFILSDTIPSLIGGGRVNAATLIFIAWFFMIYTIVLFFPGVDIITLGVILVFVEAIGSTIIKSFFGFPPFVAFFSSIFTIVVRIIYFLTLGKVIVWIFQFI